jgi:hypothetical protein
LTIGKLLTGGDQLILIILSVDSELVKLAGAVGIFSGVTINIYSRLSPSEFLALTEKVYVSIGNNIISETKKRSVILSCNKKNNS